MKKSIVYFIGICFFAGIVYGCTTKVKRISPEEIVDLSGRWNDTDSRLVAEEMVEEALYR